jgi:hypothetical protein
MRSAPKISNQSVSPGEPGKVETKAQDTQSKKAWLATKMSTNKPIYFEGFGAE